MVSGHIDRTGIVAHITRIARQFDLSEIVFSALREMVARIGRPALAPRLDRID
jgi:riboflavin synthase alpha subunit